MTEQGKTVQKWADSAMFKSEELDASQGPRVYLLQAPNDPLGSIAAACKMYKGEVVRDLADVTDDERRDYLQQILKTKLQMPFETVQFHFLLEGVTRSFTHQLVRQRTAAYAQESLRFAVVEDGLQDRVALPPSLACVPADQVHEYQLFEHIGQGMSAAEIYNRMSDDERKLLKWRDALGAVENAYHELVESGMPAEDARGLLPHNITTRVHYITNLRGLLDHAGNRLCTQAQFEWRLVFSRIAEAVRNYDPKASVTATLRSTGETILDTPLPFGNSWQYQELSKLFQPVCYTTGKCEFKADFDRKCNIRNRVDANHQIGRPSSQWSKEHDEVTGSPLVVGAGPQSVVREERGTPMFIGAIQPAEWLLNPGAAR